MCSLMGVFKIKVWIYSIEWLQANAPQFSATEACPVACDGAPTTATYLPTDAPTYLPTDAPVLPTLTPTDAPTYLPTDAPAYLPTDAPTPAPTATAAPTVESVLTLESVRRFDGSAGDGALARASVRGYRLWIARRVPDESARSLSVGPESACLSYSAEYF